MINRRRFLTGSAAFGAALVTLPRSFAFNADETVITILHTNDIRDTPTTVTRTSAAASVTSS